MAGPIIYEQALKTKTKGVFLPVACHLPPRLSCIPLVCHCTILCLDHVTVVFAEIKIM